MNESIKPSAKRNLSIFGVGPWFVLTSLLYSTIGIAIRLTWPDLMTITLLPASWQISTGIILVLIGFSFSVASLRILNNGFPKGILFTKGSYAACRHPVYGAWVVFLIPGLGLIMQSWPLIAVVAAMYMTLRLLVRKEEAELTRLFGDEYDNYRKQTPAVFPLLHRLFLR